MKTLLTLNSVFLLLCAVSIAWSTNSTNFPRNPINNDQANFTENSANIDQANSTNQLSADQKNLIQNTWQTVMQDPTNNGIAILYAFFKKYPDYQKTFGPANNVSLDELPKNDYFKKHSLVVMNVLDGAFKSLNASENFETTFSGIGERHQKRGHTKEQFEHLREVILEVLTEKFGKDFTPETSRAWTKMLSAAFYAIFKSFPPNE